MLRAGLESASPGGRLKVEVKRRGEVVDVWVAADGERRPGRALDAMWSPFTTDENRGDLTFAAVRRLVQDHGVTFRPRPAGIGPSRSPWSFPSGTTRTGAAAAGTGAASRAGFASRVGVPGAGVARWVRSDNLLRPLSVRP